MGPSKAVVKTVKKTALKAKVKVVAKKRFCKCGGEEKLVMLVPPGTNKSARATWWCGACGKEAE